MLCARGTWNPTNYSTGYDVLGLIIKINNATMMKHPFRLKHLKDEGYYFLWIDFLKPITIVSHKNNNNVLIY